MLPSFKQLKQFRSKGEVGRSPKRQEPGEASSAFEDKEGKGTLEGRCQVTSTAFKGKEGKGDPWKTSAKWGKHGLRGEEKPRRQEPGEASSTFEG